uniref:Uncharacterized protein n=1 Tax=Oryza punctata TaxID=4537 RepID=A0A0E0LE76_ORYPU
MVEIGERRGVLLFSAAAARRVGFDRAAMVALARRGKRPSQAEGPPRTRAMPSRSNLLAAAAAAAMDFASAAMTMSRKEW